MLIRWVSGDDLSAWCALAAELSPAFRYPADMGTGAEFIVCATSKIGEFEALTAVNYMSATNMGFVAFSRAENRISWLGVSSVYRGKGIGSRLLKTALRQLDTSRDITVAAFNDGEPDMAAWAVFRKYGLWWQPRLCIRVYRVLK